MSIQPQGHPKACDSRRQGTRISSFPLETEPEPQGSALRLFSTPRVGVVVAPTLAPSSAVIGASYEQSTTICLGCYHPSGRGYVSAESSHAPTITAADDAAGLKEEQASTTLSAALTSTTCSATLGSDDEARSSLLEVPRLHSDCPHSTLSSTSGDINDVFREATPGYVMGEDLEMRCGICIDEVASEDVCVDEVATLPCGHVFHLACIRRWALQEAGPRAADTPDEEPIVCTCARCFTCPICRSIFLTPPDDPASIEADDLANEFRRKRGMPTIDTGTWEELRQPADDGVPIYSAENCRCKSYSITAPESSAVAMFNVVCSFVCNFVCEFISTCLWPVAAVVVILLVCTRQFQEDD